MRRVVVFVGVAKIFVYKHCFCLQFFVSLANDAKIVRIILRVISARASENGGFFFTAGPRQRGK